MSHPWTEVAERVFVRRYAALDQTIGAVIGQAGVLIIDTRASHRKAGELLADLRSLTRAPVAAVLNTHHHWDHTFGNARFAAGPIWGHERCAELLRDHGDEMRRDISERLPDLADEFAQVVVTPPNRTFDDRAVIELGDRSVEVRYLGRGHTDNDVVAIVSDADVLFVGDLLENGGPPSYGDAYPSAWAETVEAGVLPLIRGAVVPGHGGVGDAAFARSQAAELGAMADLGRRVVREEIGEADAMAQAPFPTVTARDALARARFESAI